MSRPGPKLAPLELTAEERAEPERGAAAESERVEVPGGGVPVGRIATRLP
ncbi:hypothetical protein GCM10010517_33710 [Streptosporangium fragile]|uniref:Uncharacterized protein n=1 Tax=Streptosporangium fragile TaxID=46186 RepID=A0ABP6IFA6_9ACTN